MKKIFLPLVFFMLLAGSASAQVRRTSRHRANTTLSVTPPPSKTENKNPVQPLPVSEPDNRKEYMQDGQLATPTGHEATPVNSDEFQSLRKNRSAKTAEDH